MSNPNSAIGIILDPSKRNSHVTIWSILVAALLAGVSFWVYQTWDPKQPPASLFSNLPQEAGQNDKPAAERQEDPPRPDKPALDPKIAAEARRTLIAWLECEECTEGQLEAVAKLGNMIVPSLKASLLEGPSPASLEALRLHLDESYNALVEYARTHEEARPGSTKEQYVKRYLDNYRATYQVRSAVALSKIGGPAALQALKQADQMDFRDDVDKAVDEALVELR